MNQKYFISCLLIISMLWGACKNKRSKNTTNDNTSITSPRQSNGKMEEPQCNSTGRVVKSNRLWLKETNEILYICANESTFDKKMGDSHRMIEVYDANCKMVFSQALPVNTSPDFPYLLADINYGQSSQLLAIKGYRDVYCYDVANKKVLPPLQPDFNHKEAVDAQSGRILHLELWEKYLIGFAQDYGVFVFDFENQGHPTPVQTIADYKIGGHTRSLFLLSSDKNNFQAILPTYDSQSKLFKVNPLLEQPLTIAANQSVLSKDKRWVILNSKEKGAKTLVDLKDIESKIVPSTIQNLEPTKIFEWAME